MFKGFLIDIDNTIYDYDVSHNAAIKAVFKFASEEMQIDNFENEYFFARQNIHLELAETASSHNRLLYFQRTCERLGVNSINWALKLYNVYWNNFLDSIRICDNALSFLNSIYKKSKICFITDLTANIQFRKAEKLGLHKYSSCIVTSEETGREKPHPYMFLLAMNKLNLTPEEVCVIGDSHNKDIVGATNLGLKSIWLNKKKIKKNYDRNLVSEVENFEEMFDLVLK